MVERSERKTGTSKDSLRILQWNADSIKLKIGELFEKKKELDVDIDLNQESKLREKDKNPSIKGYSSVRADRPGERQGGGLITYIRDNIAFETRRCWNEKTGNVESSTIKIRLSKKKWITLSNLYIPPNRGTGTEETLVPLRTALWPETSTLTTHCGTRCNPKTAEAIALRSGWPKTICCAPTTARPLASTEARYERVPRTPSSSLPSGEREWSGA